MGPILYLTLDLRFPSSTAQTSAINIYPTMMNQTSPSHSSSHATEHSHHQKHSSPVTTLLESISDLRDIDTKVNDWKLPYPHHPSSSNDNIHECHAHSPLVHEFNEKEIIEAITNGGCPPYAQKKECCEIPDEGHGDGRGIPALPSPIPVSSSTSKSRPCRHNWRNEQLGRKVSENPMEVKESGVNNIVSSSPQTKSPLASLCPWCSSCESS